MKKLKPACARAMPPVGLRGAATTQCLENRSDADASYLTIGARNQLDTIHYPDHNLITHKDGAARRYSQSDGSPYPERTSK